MQADSIKIESDEQGFELHVETDEGDRFAFNIHGCAEALHEQVNLIIGGWLAEGQVARREWKENARAIVGESISEAVGYDINDPKHPAFHSIHADHYDNREKV